MDRWWLMASAVLVAACEQAPAREITIVDGPTTTRFTVQSANAEYVELPGDHNELRLTLASHAVSCERWIPPGEHDTALTVVIVLPTDVRPSPTSYPWAGMPPHGEPIHEAYALPKVQLGNRSRLFEPGGTIRLTTVQLEPRGTVAGTVAFEFPGDAERPATRISGGFDAKLCRVAPAAH